MVQYFLDSPGKTLGEKRENTKAGNTFGVFDYQVDGKCEQSVG